MSRAPRRAGARRTRSAAAPIFRVSATAVLTLATIATVYVVGMRSGNGPVRGAARWVHRAVGNPIQMRTAGTPGAYASVLQHQGRKTGRVYRTPVWAAATEDGFVVPIVYGARSDWLRNVLASGSASIVHGGT